MSRYIADNVIVNLHLYDGAKLIKGHLSEIRTETHLANSQNCLNMMLSILLNFLIINMDFFLLIFYFIRCLFASLQWSLTFFSFKYIEGV